VGAGVAANPGEAVLQEAAGEELIHDLGDHRAPVAHNLNRWVTAAAVELQQRTRGSSKREAARADGR
jgi:hypothetical protein